MTRALAALLLAAGLLLTAGCSNENTSGDTNTDNQSDMVPTQSPSSR
ncbi:MAG: hypothetical protein JWN88_2060 [Frankiales bacterium]|jgi:hypothetical protein|nr:hypothetical protein [Frankiales bacterium]